MTHETHRCTVDGCPNLAGYEVWLYDFDPAAGAVVFRRDDSCPYICVEHAIDNEHHAGEQRTLHARVPYPYTNREQAPGLTVYLDLPPNEPA
jgi:hypothetical protein